MAAQFDLYELRGGTLVVILQSDLLDQLTTRVVAPLLPAGTLDRVLKTLNPAVQVTEETYVVMPQLMATVTLAELGRRIGTLQPDRDEIVRAVDALMWGI